MTKPLKRGIGVTFLMRLDVVTVAFLCRLGGPDPLDFISMFNNPGSPMEGIPSHWHYISAGLSDLHGDGRVHEYAR